MSMNPFTVGQQVTPDCFIGQKSLIRTAFDQIRNHSHLAVWGGTGMGKSSFLQLLTYPVVWQQNGLDPTKTVIVLFDCQNIEPFKASDFWRNILVEISHNFLALKTDIDSLLEKDKNTKDHLINILRKLIKQNKSLLLLIDNYDVALRSNSEHTEAEIIAFVSECRTIAISKTEGEHISMIVTSSRRLSEIGPQLTLGSSPWYNQYAFRHIKPFTDAEVDILLAKNQSLSTWKEAIRKIADGNPALLQNACYLLHEEIDAGNTINQTSFIREFQTATLHLFQTMWGLSSETEQTLLMLLALLTLEGKLGKNRYTLGGIEAVLSQKERELDNLVERGILKQVEGEKIHYAFCSSIMEWWVIKQIENSDQEELKKRQRTFLNLMSRQQAGRVNTAIGWIWQNKDKIVPIIQQLLRFL